jgi:hypothetical protein
MGPQKSKPNMQKFAFFLAFCAANLQLCSELDSNFSQK